MMAYSALAAVFPARESFTTGAVGVFIAITGLLGFIAGALVSAALRAVAVLLLVRDARRQRHGWLAFGTLAAPLLACLVPLVHSRPRAINLPDTIDLAGFSKVCRLRCQPGDRCPDCFLRDIGLPSLETKRRATADSQVMMIVRCH